MRIRWRHSSRSLVIEGVPERFPRLKIVFIEGGFGWIPSTMWRMDQHFERFRDEVPHLKRRPSEYVREHFWFTTQPIDEPDEAKHLRSLIDGSASIGCCSRRIIRIGISTIRVSRSRRR